MRIIGAVHMLSEGSIGVLTSESASTDDLALVLFCPTNLSPNKEVPLLFGREAIEAFLHKATWATPISPSDALTLRVLAMDDATQKVYLTTKEMPHELRQLPHRMISPSEIPLGAVLSPWADEFVHFAHVAHCTFEDVGTSHIAHHAILALPVAPNDDLVSLLQRVGFNVGLRDMLMTGAMCADPDDAKKQFDYLLGIHKRANTIKWQRVRT